MKAEDLKAELQKYASAEDAVFLQRFFKTAPGQYGEGDIFIGVRVPMTRKTCKQFKDLPPLEVQKLLNSKIHEHRLAAVIILSEQYKRANSVQKQKIYELYLLNVLNNRINNWDIVDTSADHIIGAHLMAKPRKLIFDLAKSNSVWQRRVAVLSTFAFIKHGDSTTTIQLAEKLINDKHDLIQKAAGWMLREIGQRVDRKVLTDFLDRHAAVMPRTMLRYSIEKLSPDLRKHYMLLKSF